MTCDLDRARKELEASPLLAPYPTELAVAIVCDCFRMAGAAPVPVRAFERWLSAGKPLFEEQLGMLAWILNVSCLRAETGSLMRSANNGRQRLDAFFDAIEPLTAEMIRANRFRQEEFLRRWIDCWGGGVRGESAEQSKTRLDELDYRKTLEEYKRAERDRKSEEKRRAQLLREAQERETAARGWRE
jgi:hypothetical protein